MNEIAIIKQLKWVKSVRRYPIQGLVVVTKPSMLKILLTHYVEKQFDGELWSAHKMKEPIVVGLPSYKLKLTLSRFKLALTERPKKLMNSSNTMIHPMGSRIDSKELLRTWKSYCAPCLGSTYDREYMNAKTDFDRVMIAARYLQSAIPDWGGTHRKSVYAYTHRLVGDEIIQPK